MLDSPCLARPNLLNAPPHPDKREPSEIKLAAPGRSLSRWYKDHDQQEQRACDHNESPTCHRAQPSLPPPASEAGTGAHALSPESPPGGVLQRHPRLDTANPRAVGRVGRLRRAIRSRDAFRANHRDACSKTACRCRPNENSTPNTCNYRQMKFV